MIRQLIVFRRDDFSDLLPEQSTPKPKSPEEDEKLLAKVDERLRGLLGGFKGPLNNIEIPLLDWRVQLALKPPQNPPPLDQVVISVDMPELADLTQFRKAVDDTNKRARDRGERETVLGVGADVSVSGSEYFCPANIDQVLFGDRNAAASLTESDVLKQQGLTGQGVNIVVIDQGFDASKVRRFGGGLANGTIGPGTTTRGHGMMIVRNIVEVAPDATFYDVPLIPLKIDDVPGFVSTALHVFLQLRQIIGFLRGTSVASLNGPWVLVNAWSIFDRTSEIPLGDYTENPNHPLNVLVGAIVDDAIDVVFAAGNCGQFCPDRRCGERDVGPGSSIFGANSHPRVMTVGAVRTDARWMGNSSQGPGQRLLSLTKPDLCAPSYFREVGDAFIGNTAEPFVGDTGSPYIANTGSSAACAVAAGIIGAIRSGWDQTSLTPDDLRNALNAHARKTEGPAWNERLGNGIINVKDTLSALGPRTKY
jgi:subtilisin family serine protease